MAWVEALFPGFAGLARTTSSAHPVLGGRGGGGRLRPRRGLPLRAQPPGRALACGSRPGSAAATLLWLVASLGFGLYVANFGNYNATYGSLGGVVVFLTWLYLTAYIVLMGGELNSIIEVPQRLGQRLSGRAWTARRRQAPKAHGPEDKPRRRRSPALTVGDFHTVAQKQIMNAVFAALAEGKMEWPTIAPFLDTAREVCAGDFRENARIRLHTTRAEGETWVEAEEAFLGISVADRDDGAEWLSET